MRVRRYHTVIGVAAVVLGLGLVVGVLAADGAPTISEPAPTSVVSSTPMPAATSVAPGSAGPTAEPVQPLTAPAAQVERIDRVVAALNSMDSVGFFAEFAPVVTFTVNGDQRDFHAWAVGGPLIHQSTITVLPGGNDGTMLTAMFSSDWYGVSYGLTWIVGFDANGLIDTLVVTTIV